MPVRAAATSASRLPTKDSIATAPPKPMRYPDLRCIGLLHPHLLAPDPRCSAIQRSASNAVPRFASSGSTKKQFDRSLERPASRVLQQVPKDLILSRAV